MNGESKWGKLGGKQLDIAIHPEFITGISKISSKVLLGFKRSTPLADICICLHTCKMGLGK